MRAKCLFFLFFCFLSILYLFHFMSFLSLEVVKSMEGNVVALVTNLSYVRHSYKESDLENQVLQIKY
jgi:hypothetical protein